MTLKLYLVGIIFTIVLAFASFFSIIIFFSPEGTDALLQFLLFLSLFIGLTGFFGLVGFLLRKKKYNKFDAFRFFGVSFRQGTLLSVLLVGSLFLRAFTAFWWWGSLVLLLLVLIIEFFFLRKDE